MFVSYAQNYEDVALWRALSRVEGGFYVDLGAQHPITHNVSKAFYERGWRGIHVEPVPTYAAQLQHDRPEDSVVAKAVADRRGRMTLHVLSESGLSTLDKAAAERGAEILGSAAVALEVEVVTLDDVLALRGDKPIHWMKIDIEGAEKPALMGWNARKYRPWIVVVEATLPNTQIPSHQEWEPILLTADYVFAYFDGLNRFYVARERSDLIEPLRKPPSVFDQFVTHEMALREARIEVLTSLIDERDGMLAETNAELNLLRRKLAQEPAGKPGRTSPEAEAPAALPATPEERPARRRELEIELGTQKLAMQRLQEAYDAQRRELVSLRNSTSWKLTKPLRKLATAVRVVRHQPELFWKILRRNVGFGPPPG